MQRKKIHQDPDTQQRANHHCACQGWAHFFLQGQIVNTLGFASHAVSVATTQLCHGSTKAAINNNK